MNGIRCETYGGVVRTTAARRVARGISLHKLEGDDGRATKRVTRQVDDGSFTEAGAKVRKKTSVESALAEGERYSICLPQ